jgi:hypothetical protein
MPLSSADNILVGGNLHYTAWAESVWGTKPGSPDEFLLPLTECGIKLNRKRRNNLPYFGQFGRKHGKTVSGYPQGNIAGALHGYHPAGLSKSVAQWLLEMAFNSPASNDLPSFGIESAQGPDIANKQWDGLRMNSFTLSGSEDDGVVMWSADVIGKLETQPATAYTVPDDLEKFSEFEFSDCVLTVADSSDGVVLEMQSFQLVRNNGLKPAMLGGRSPTHLKRTQRNTTFQCVILKNSDDYDDAERLFIDNTPDSEYDLTLTLRGLHNGSSTNNYTTVSIVMARAQLATPDDAHAVEDYSRTTLNFDLLKPDTSEADFAISFSTAS